MNVVALVHETNRCDIQNILLLLFEKLYNEQLYPNIQNVFNVASLFYIFCYCLLQGLCVALKVHYMKAEIKSLLPLACKRIKTSKKLCISG